MKLYQKLKDYQKTLVDKNIALIKEVVAGEKIALNRQISVSPTGSGKTFMMASIIENGLKLDMEPCFVWLTHNKQILFQTQNEILDALGNSVITVYNIEQNIQGFGGRVLLFNVQKGVSIKSKDWLRRWKKYHDDQNRQIILIIDEADEGMSGNNMAALKKVLSPILELGFTASFKKKNNEYEFHRVLYKEVIDAGMLVKQIEYQASDEVTRTEMMSRAIKHRHYLESIAEKLQLIGRFFVPKMLIQTQAREAESVAIEIKAHLNLSDEDFAKQVIVHTQNSRGLEQVDDMDDVRYIIGDMMLERGWNCPEVFILLSTKDSVSEAKGIQLLGRVIRLPNAEPFDEIFDVFNRGYVFIAGKHSIEQSCQKFANQDINPLPPPKEVIQVDRQEDLIIPNMITFVDELDKDLEDKDLIPTSENLCDTIDALKKKCSKDNPSIRQGKLSLEETSLTRKLDEAVEVEWNLEQAKKILIDALAKHCPRGYANLVITKYQIRKGPKGGLSEIAPFGKELSQQIKESGIIKRICEKLEYLYQPYEWPSHKLIVAQPAPLKCDRALYPKMQVNFQEQKFASFLNSICSNNGFHFTRNDRSDIRLIRGHFPDFIVFNETSYLFIEFKGKHLLNTPDTIRKNRVGQAAHDYYLVYEDEDTNKYILLGCTDEVDEEFTEEHISLLLLKNAA